MAQADDVRYYAFMEIVVSCDEEDFGPSWSREDVAVGGAEVESPFVNPLGDGYLFDTPGSPVSCYGMCPLCNNARHRELDATLMRGDVRALYGMGFTRREVARHLVHHVGQAYKTALLPLLEASGEFEDGYLEEKFPEVIRVLKGMEARNGRRERVRSEGGYVVLDDGILPGGMGVGMQCGSEPGAGGPGPVSVHDELLDDPRIGREYAMDGGRGIRPLRPWTQTRSVAEMALRQVEAINFYDEMMDIRARAVDIYDRIMGEKQADGSWEGGLVDPRVVDLENGTNTVVGGDPKLMSIAVASIREMTGVVDTLCKMSLIAKKLGDDGPGEELDPAIKSIVDSIGKRKAIEVPVEVIDASMEDEVKDLAARNEAAAERASTKQLPMRTVTEESDA